MYCKHGCRHCAIKIQASKLAIFFCWREKTIDTSNVFLNNELHQTPTTVFHHNLNFTDVCDKNVVKQRLL